MGCTAKPPQSKGLNTKSDVISNELLVKFNEGTPQGEVDKIITDCKGELIKHLDGINVFHLKVSTSVGEGINCFKKYTSVKYAEPNRVVKVYK